MQLDMQVLPRDTRHNNTRLVTTNRWCLNRINYTSENLLKKSKTAGNVFDNALGRRQVRGWSTDSQGYWLKPSSGFYCTGQSACFTWIRATDVSNYVKHLGAGDRIPEGGRDFPPVQTGRAFHPGPYTMGTRSFPGVNRPGRGVDHLSQI